MPQTAKSTKKMLRKLFLTEHVGGKRRRTANHVLAPQPETKPKTFQVCLQLCISPVISFEIHISEILLHRAVWSKSVSVNTRRLVSFLAAEVFYQHLHSNVFFYAQLFSELTFRRLIIQRGCVLPVLAANICISESLIKWHFIKISPSRS